MISLPLILGRATAEVEPLLARLAVLCDPLAPALRPPEELQRIHLPGSDTVVLLLGLDAPEIVRCLGRLGVSGGPRRILVQFESRDAATLSACARAGATLCTSVELMSLEGSILVTSERATGSPSSQSIHRLLRDYNHFLRNRLSTLEQIMALLADHLDQKPAVHVWTRRLEGELKRIEGTTERLLELSSPLSDEVESIDPLEVFQHVAEHARKSATSAVEFEFHVLTRPLPRVRGQRELASAVATEVLQNAIAHALRSPAAARVMLSFTATETTVEIQVGHSGSGIPTEDGERALAPFFTTEAAGTGLGLTIARRFLDHMGGELVLVEREDQGLFPLLRFARADRAEF